MFRDQSAKKEILFHVRYKDIYLNSNWKWGIIKIKNCGDDREVGGGRRFYWGINRYSKSKYDILQKCSWSEKEIARSIRKNETRKHKEKHIV